MRMFSFSILLGGGWLHLLPHRFHKLGTALIRANLEINIVPGCASGRVRRRDHGNDFPAADERHPQNFTLIICKKDFAFRPQSPASAKPLLVFRDDAVTPCASREKFVFG